MKRFFAWTCYNGLLCLLLALGLSTVGCVSKTKAKLKEREAFMAGQQQAMAMARFQQQSQNPSVTVVGQVRNPVIPWTEDLTVAKAVVASEYFGKNPKEIIIVHQGQATRIEAKRLLAGDDLPVEAGDTIQIVQ